jgi:predicted enzyme related to lactoylglutathione lyase
LEAVTSLVMDVDVAFTGVPVSALLPARGFFERLFGRPADVVVSESEVMWRVTTNAWLYIVVDEARAGHALTTIAVDDLDAALSELGNRGLTPAEVEMVGEAGRKATLCDPDGNRVAIIEVA